MLKSDNTVGSWGNNAGGNLGNGSYANSSVPLKIDTLKEITAISANSQHSLALTKDGTVWFWGSIKMKIVDGEDVCQNTPMKIAGLENIKMIHASAVNPLLFMKNDGSYWSYDVKTKELNGLPL